MVEELPLTRFGCEKESLMEKSENPHAIIDQMGIKQEDLVKILATFEDYYTNIFFIILFLCIFV